MNIPGKGVHSIPPAGGATHMPSVLGCLTLASTEAGWAGAWEVDPTLVILALGDDERNGGEAWWARPGGCGPSAVEAESWG